MSAFGVKLDQQLRALEAGTCVYLDTWSFIEGRSWVAVLSVPLEFNGVGTVLSAFESLGCEVEEITHDLFHSFNRTMNGVDEGGDGKTWSVVFKMPKSEVEPDVDAEAAAAYERLRGSSYATSFDGRQAQQVDVERIWHALGRANNTIERLQKEINGPTFMGEPVLPHADDVAVDRFATAMKAKLADARSKGRGGWQEHGLHQHLSDLLRDHVHKGDPRDVANFCCFLWNRGEAIAPAAAPGALQDILAEVGRATRKFPTWPTDPLHALGVLGEEFGELTKAVMQATYEPHKNRPDDVRSEAIQTAAMALRFVDSLDRYVHSPCHQHSQEAS